MADLVISFTIESNDKNEFVDAFLEQNPKDSEFAGTDDEWIEEVLHRYATENYIAGQNKKGAQEKAKKTDIVKKQ